MGVRFDIPSFADEIHNGFLADTDSESTSCRYGIDFLQIQISKKDFIQKLIRSYWGYGLGSQGEVGLLMAMNFVFSTGMHNGSTLTILGRNPVFHKGDVSDRRKWAFPIC
ncbi:hypothetical protein L1887_24318 [Cichorium endivia]|nr:hypothetical protein L1887_24318 [Cichorium endivia]